MKKWLAPVFVAAMLFGNLALCETQKQEIKAESQEINEEYVYFYEMTLSNPELSPTRKMAYKNSYRTFMINVTEENIKNNPDLFEGLQED